MSETEDRPSRPLVLVVDDEPTVRYFLRRLLETDDYRVAEAADGLGAIEAVRTLQPDLVLLDIGMPPPDGLQVTRRLRASPGTELLPVILVTGFDDVARRVAGLDAGATDYVWKPFEPPELLARVRAHLRTKTLLDRLESAQNVLVALASAVEAKDPATERHCSRMAELSAGLARAAGIEGELVEAASYGAALHDVGKIGIAEAILRKPAPLDEAEWDSMREHPLIGAAIVEPLRIGRLVGPIVRHHHEWWNGHGYPAGLAAESIPIGARIVSIVDAYDAMIHDRPYRSARPAEAALDEIRQQAGIQFDPDLARLFVDQVDRLDAAIPDLDSALVRGLFVEPVPA